MPIGQLERAARSARGDLYPQSSVGRQVYWTVLGEFDQAEEALFDEYGNLEPQCRSAQITPLLRLGGALHGAPGKRGHQPIPGRRLAAHSERHLVCAGRRTPATALAHAGEALVEYHITNRSGTPQRGALVLAVRPVQINPYWQHGNTLPSTLSPSMAGSCASTIGATPRFRANPRPWPLPTSTTEM